MESWVAAGGLTGEAMNKSQDNRGGAPLPSRVGVYICRCGGNISDHVDVEAVCESARKLPGVSVARTNAFMCSDPGQDLIAKDLRNGTVDCVVVASCSPSLHESTFRNTIRRAGGNPYRYEHANIREQVSWVHHGPAATEKAARLVAAAAAKAGLLEPLEPIRVEARRHVTVIGGGIAGMKAALDLARHGFEVVLIEKSSLLGGRTARLDRLAPAGESAAEAVTELARGVLEHPAVTLHTSARVVGFDGCVGQFTLRVRKGPPEDDEALSITRHAAASGVQRGDYLPFLGVYAGASPASSEVFLVATGAVVLATGFDPYAPRKGEFGYGIHPEVTTLPELIPQMARAPSNERLLRIAGRPVRSVAMVHCVGSRQIPGLHDEDPSRPLNEYCSRTCCSALLQAANRIRTTWPETRVYDFYRDIRTYGRGQEALYTEASRNGVVFFRFEPDRPPVVAANPGGGEFPLKISVADTLTFGETIEVPVDLVVLAVGMEPHGIGDLVEQMKLPVGTDRFLLEVHPKLRPVELPTTGLFLAGTCQAPMDTGEASAAASAAAAKASALLARGSVSLDPFVAEVDPAQCRGCGTCVEACLGDGALELATMDVAGEQVRRARIHPAFCLGCGACVGVCPEGAVQLQGWTLAQYEAMVDAIVSDLAV